MNNTLKMALKIGAATILTSFAAQAFSGSSTSQDRFQRTALQGKAAMSPSKWIKSNHKHYRSKKHHHAQHASKELSQVRYGSAVVDGLGIFYRESGNPKKQAVVLLHGLPTSSHMYRELLDELGDDYYLIAPDYPGFGESSAPSPSEYTYTFDNLANTIDDFLIQKNINDYVLMLQDYGAPVGYRIALKHPEKVKGLIIMNGNAYEEGVNPETTALVDQYSQDRNNTELEQTILSSFFSLAGIKWQYTHGTRNPEGISPDNWNLDFMKLSREGQDRIQLDLLFDYQNNIAQYPIWQQYLKDNQPPALLVWGKNDPFFTVAGAQAYKNDLDNIDFNLLDTGHFALEEESEFIIHKMRKFLKYQVK